ncbi:Protein-tyrosine phosphatase, receptor/non-receptor type domain and Protein-tyrosine/Dual specificity phosphatase domain and Protein-tyrosine phosphatase, catalytic domain-containing protein [Strongyloides ratti]|uniref:Protein-tyrosine phosphatase, receptor/non-receptor type domain and Protein-tyrosine/Dual specificity phosphatase domain and Protein-tyrosine phosphatase, catalytic domain-containing protein n=1 Tax=Strongyloides ratti TaxID=34506 RepID=A0A090KXH3_STRRB|nr:Protein-tyrosine phosphatase, receptor/non-receptor type domain and Protein-tyrosine/Dual specificity phosphatase domain and Protein-tyrosine phosphatase, catalytic domain-containing protein [Strongyloides ratti]CEF62116.1 Protein-tyrosine phosphatase, receptor/non-receptor type domain and Protein-tyrosine/Dual specificity phosphatase domain and Protein-tyrosine phosphatase, catalytic domain-containing protein [Strongyloides ratti]
MKNKNINIDKNVKEDGSNKCSNFNKNLIAFVKSTCDMGVENLIKEFQGLQLYEKKHMKNHKAFNDNINKCRYRDVFCNDEHRFILKCESNDDNQNDFIHANYMSSSKCSPFIATQGPLPNTINDFWKMVWQSKAYSIVMICDIIENGKKKCEQYWPLNPLTEIKAGVIVVKFLDKQKLDKNIVKSTLLMIKREKKIRLVHHFQYFGWPDRGVPINYSPCIRLMKKATKNLPIIIHCSAGIGRTGTMICLDEILKKLNTSEECLYVKNIILEKRRFRYGIVQTEIQYLFIHRVLLYLAVKKKLVDNNVIAQFVKNYDTIVTSLNCNQLKKPEQQKEKVEIKIEQIKEPPIKQILDSLDGISNQVKDNNKLKELLILPDTQKRNKNNSESEESPEQKKDIKDESGFMTLIL